MATTNPIGSGHRSSEFKWVAALSAVLPVLVKFKEGLGFEYLEPQHVTWGLVTLGCVYILQRGAVKVAAIWRGVNGDA